MPPHTHNCGIDAEPFYRYEPGGYHPVELGETLKDGRYKVLHKLGWGGFSTTWAAKDQKTNSYVAVKVKISKDKDTRELEVLQALSALPKHHPGSSHINQLRDHFTIDGPNGFHECLVLEITGPNIDDAACSRLPANIVKVVAKQVLQGLDFLAANDIAHGGKL
ncbi:Serine/threonine-protein kinase SKY1 [Fusarium culmorum]|uniref:non-specific serine/threonine protein kinase n=1 Tax=Fusarium culmorum TaxID=5516 RepID=A0A2T4GZE9_FUSCU|nr:Serine/threonine-protein kinase SKY1 [Fusarium culmorum]